MSNRYNQIISTFLLLSSMIFAQDYYTVELAETGQTQLTLITTDITSLQAGDEIGIFDENGVIESCLPPNYGGNCDPATETQYGEVLVGAGVWNEEQLNIVSIMYVDQSGINGPILNGAIDGNPVFIKIWRESEQMEYATELTWSVGTGNFGDMLQSVSEIVLTDPNACEDDNSLVSPFSCADFLPGGSMAAIGCNGDWAGTLVSDACPVTCDACPEVPVFGCTDESACNYDSEATDDDGSCAEDDCAGECGGSAEDLGCGCGEAAPDECDTCDGSIVDLGCGCGEAAPDECDTCDGSIVDLGCGCGEPAAEENFDCDGNCVVEVDCAGDCGGTAYEVTLCEDTDGDGLGNPGSETTECVDGGRDVSNGCDLPVDNILLNSDGSVVYNSSSDIGGFQFNVDGISTIAEASGGDAGAAEFTITTSGNMALGFSLTGASFGPCGTMVNLAYDGDATGLSGFVIANAIGEQISFEYYVESDDPELVYDCSDEYPDCASNIVDCADECDGSAVEDECGECNGDGIDEGTCDCEGTLPEENFDCDGNCIAVIDCAGECGGDAVDDCNDQCNGTSVEDSIGGCCEAWFIDCAGECFGSAMEDCAGECNGSAVIDCNDDCGGTSELDCAGECGGTSELDCNDQCNGTAVEDSAGGCCEAWFIDCAGECFGSAMEDCAGECNGSAVIDCNDDCGGDAEVDECGECGGDGTECEGFTTGCTDISACNFNSEATFDDGTCEENDCIGECGGSATEDCAGECNGSAMEDCAGECNGSAVIDCNDDCGGTSELDCAGDCGGTSELDCNDQCNGSAVEDSIGGCCEAWFIDCAGECFGSAMEDCAGECNGSAVIDCNDDCGGTAVVDCANDCNGEAVEDCTGQCNGDAVVDNCGVCNGDGSSCIINVDFSLGDAVDGGINVFMYNTHDVQGFQFDISGMLLDSTVVASGGSADAAGFSVSVGPNGVLGVSMTGSSIPAGESSLLTSLSGSIFDDFEACITDIVLSIDGEGFHTYTPGDCVVTDAVADCEGAPNGDAVEDECGVCNGDGIVDGTCDCDGTLPAENFDCDGNCLIETDCAGECGGTAVEDECGVCEGGGIAEGTCNCDGTLPEENFDCDGNCLIETDCAGECGGTSDLDECGVCDGDNSSCLDSCGVPNGLNDCFTYPEILVDSWTLVQQSVFSSEDCSGDAISTITGPFSLEEGGVECTSITIELSDEGLGVITCATVAFDITQNIIWADNNTGLCVDAGEGFSCAPYSVDGEIFTQQGYDEESGTCSELQYQLSSTLAIDEFGIPKDFSVYQNYPNPFNPSTTIEFDVATSSNVSLVVYDLTGKEVYSLASGYHVPGRYSVVWNAIDSKGESVSSGMYIYQLRTSDAVLTKKLVLLR